MDDFGDKLNAILNDPAALARIGELAKSVMGGEAERGEPEPELDPGLISRVMGLLKRNGVKSEERALLEAMKLARLAGLAGIAAAEFGLGEKEEGDV